MNVFQVHVDHQDIESMMGQVSAELARWESGADGPKTPFSMPLGGDADTTQAIALLQTSWNINSQAIIHSTRPRIGRHVIRFQQFVRRATWWFLEPIIQQVRAFNGNATRAIGGLFRRQNRMEERMAELVTRVEELENTPEQGRGR